MLIQRAPIRSWGPHRNMHTASKVKHVADYKVCITDHLHLQSYRIRMDLIGKSDYSSRLVTTNVINLKEPFTISKALMFQTLLLTCVSNEYEHPSLTSVVMMASCKASLNKAAYQAAELPGNISGSLKARAELVTKWRLL